MTTYLIIDGQLRAETDAEVISNLRRKGWQDAPAKPSEDAQWTDGRRVGCAACGDIHRRGNSVASLLALSDPSPVPP